MIGTYSSIKILDNINSIMIGNGSVETNTNAKKIGVVLESTISMSLLFPSVPD